MSILQALLEKTSWKDIYEEQYQLSEPEKQFQELQKEETRGRKGKKVVATSDEEVIVATSITQLANHLGVSCDTVKGYANQKFTLFGYKIKL